jgi:hypothetical protein
MNSHGDFYVSRHSEMEAVRARFLRLGKLPEMTKGTVVYIDFFGSWEKVRLTRKIPGGCWIAKLMFRHPFCTKTTVSVTNFGGVEAE